MSRLALTLSWQSLWGGTTLPSPMDERVVLVTCVHFNDAARVGNFVRHLVADVRAPDGWRIEVTICDNSANFQPDSVAESIRVEVSPGNLGYLNGAAYALQCWRAEHEIDPEWVVISGADVALEPDFFVQLAAMDVDRDVGVLAPSIRTPAGQDENPYQTSKLPRYKVVWSIIATSSVLAARVLPALEMRAKRALGWMKSSSDRPPIRAGEIYAPHGSLLILHSRFVKAPGALSFPGFLYGEEEFIGAQARKHGLRVVMAPELRALHTRQGSLGETTPLKRRVAWSRKAAWIRLRHNL